MESEEFDAAAYKYRAFISYSREDRGLVDDLYKRLTKWRAPGPLRKRQGKYGPPPRALSVYMDRKSQQTGEILSTGLRDKLEQSAFLIVVCSKAGADPDSWVTREIEHFLKIASPDRIIPIIVREEANQPLSEVFPAPLLAMGEDAPIGADLLHDGGIVPVTHKVIGGLTGFSQNEIAREQERTDRLSRRRRQVSLALAAMSLGLAISGFGILVQRDEALFYRSVFMVNRARETSSAGAYDFALLFAIEGANSGKGVLLAGPQDSTLFEAIPSAISNNLTTLVMRPEGGGLSQTVISPDGSLVAMMLTSGVVNVVEVDFGKTRFSLPPIVAPIIAVFSPDGQYLVRATQGQVEIYNPTSGQLVVDYQVNFQFPSLFFSENSRHIFAVDQNTGAYQGWSLATGDPLEGLPVGRIMVTDDLFQNALVRRFDGGIAIIDLNQATSIGMLASSHDVPISQPAKHADIRILNTNEPLFSDNFDPGYQEIIRAQITAAARRSEEAQEKISNFGAGMPAIGNPLRPVQLTQPDRQYFMNGDTIVEYQVPSAAGPAARSFPVFTIRDVSDQRQVRTINGIPVNISRSGEVIFYIDQADCELKAFVRSTNTPRTIRPQPDGCNGGYLVSQFFVSPDEQYAIAAFTDGLFLFNLNNISNEGGRIPAPVALPHGLNERINGAGFDAQSNIAYTFTDDGVRLWEPSTADPLGRINGVVISVDASGRRIVTLGEDRASRVSDLTRLPLRETLPGSAFLSQSGERALMVDTVNIDHFAPYIIDFNTGARIAELSKKFDRRIVHANMTRSGDLAATLTADDQGVNDAYIELWDGLTGEPRGIVAGAPTRIDFPVNIADFMLLEDSASVVIRGINNVWYSFDLRTGREIWRNAALVNYQIFGQTENFNLLLLGNISGANAIVWSPSENRVVLVLPPNIQTIASTDDNSLVATSSGNAIALYRRAANGQYQQAGVYSEHNAAIASLRINKAGDTVLSASTDRTAHLWDARTGRKLREFREPEFAITSAIFNAREDRVITTSLSGFVRVWDAASGLEIAGLQVESSGANYSWSARLGPDEREIIISTIRSTRRFALPPQYDGAQAMVKAACEALPPGATLGGDYVKDRYKLRSTKGEGGDPCAHYGLLHWKYYRVQWCSTIGYGCGGDGGWLRSMAGGRAGG